MRNLFGSATITPVTCRRGGSRIESLERTSKVASPARKLSTAEMIAFARYDILRRIARRPTGQFSVMTDPSAR